MRQRPYQHDAHHAIQRSLAEHGSSLLVMATGLGKTIVFAHLISKYRHRGKVLVLAHRDLLIHQAAQKIKAVTGIDAGIEMAGSYAEADSKVIVSSIQTQVAVGARRMKKFDPQDFSLVIIDECFPAGTLIGDISIELIRPGDRIWTMGPEGVETKRVIRTMARPVQQLCRLKFNDGTHLVCTPNHPVYVRELSGFLPAAMLYHGIHVMHAITRSYDYDSTYMDQDVQHLRERFRDIEQSPDVRQAVRAQGSRPTTQANYDAWMSMVRKARRMQGAHWKISGEKGQSILLRKVQESLAQTAALQDHGKYEQAIRLSQDEGQEPHEAAGDQSQSLNETSGHGLGANAAQGQWPRHDGTRAADGISIGMGAIGGADENGQAQRLSQSLQDRRGQQGLKGSSRDRWPITWGPRSESQRRQEGRILKAKRVESVEIYEPRSRDELEAMCPGGLVFNLEVEDNHNYFADGILVHNCHHAVAKTYRKVIDYYRKNEDAKLLGVTATPDRGDKLALGQVFKDVAFEYDILPGIKDGWLVPIQQRFPIIEGLDYSHIHTNAGDFNRKELAMEMQYERNLYPMAKVVADASEGHKVLVFSASKAHAERMCEITNRYHEGAARFVTDDTPKSERAKTFADYALGEFNVLVNVGIATEGFDQPDIDVVAMCRPTKSRSLYCQMVGRGTRPLPGIVDTVEGGDSLWNADAAKLRRKLIEDSGKPALTVIDFVGNAGRHKLITSLDILGGETLSEEEKDNLKVKLAREGKAVDPIDAVRRHEIMMQQRAAQERARQARKRRSLLRPTVKYRWRKIDPFDRYDIRPPRAISWQTRKPPTAGQLRMLNKANIDTKGLDFKTAGMVCQKLIAEWKGAGITAGQRRFLQKKGVKTDGLSKRDASRMIDWMIKTGRRPKGEDEVQF